MVAFGRLLSIAFGVLAGFHAMNTENLSLREIVKQPCSVSQASLYCDVLDIAQRAHTSSRNCYAGISSRV